MKCTLTRKVMTFVRIFILDQSTVFIEQFLKLLAKFWSNFLLFVWWNNKNFTSLNGNKLKSFVTNITMITNIIATKFALLAKITDIF